jgi:hypothetical protein
MIVENHSIIFTPLFETKNFFLHCFKKDNSHSFMCFRMIRKNNDGEDQLVDALMIFRLAYFFTPRTVQYVLFLEIILNQCGKIQ